MEKRRDNKGEDKWVQKNIIYRLINRGKQRSLVLVNRIKKRN